MYNLLFVIQIPIGVTVQIMFRTFYIEYNKKKNSLILTKISEIVLKNIKQI